MVFCWLPAFLLLLSDRALPCGCRLQEFLLFYQRLVRRLRCVKTLLLRLRRLLWVSRLLPLC